MLERADTEEAICLNRSRLRSTRPFAAPEHSCPATRSGSVIPVFLLTNVSHVCRYRPTGTTGPRPVPAAYFHNRERTERRQPSLCVIALVSQCTTSSSLRSGVTKGSALTDTAALRFVLNSPASVPRTMCPYMQGPSQLAAGAVQPVACHAPCCSAVPCLRLPPVTGPAFTFKPE
jgi:hypothetical protein